MQDLTDQQKWQNLGKIVIPPAKKITWKNGKTGKKRYIEKSARMKENQGFDKNIHHLKVEVKPSGKTEREFTWSSRISFNV